MQTTEEDIGKAQELIIQSNELVNTIQTDLSEINDVRVKVKEYFEKLNILQCTYQYLRVVQYIESLK